MRRQISILAAAVAVCGGSVAVAGCGGGSKSSAAPGSSAPAKQTKASRQHDCTVLGHVVTDLALADAGGFDFARDRAFIDGYAGRAPSDVSDSVDRLKDILDRFADAAEQAGLKPGDTPLPDQADKIKDAFHYSSDDQAANARAVQTVDAWVTNGCDS
jgi:hypothetical protein